MSEIPGSAQLRHECNFRETLRENSMEVLDDSDLIQNACDGEKLKQENLAPDGGWGYMVALGMTMVLIIAYTTVSCIPIIFGEILKSTGQAGSAIALLNTLMIISWSISALFTNALLKKYSMRATGITSAILSSVFEIMAAIVTNFYQLVIIFIIQGIAMGIMLTICQCNFNAYFLKKRIKIFSAVQMLIGIGTTLYTILIGVMMETYGFRGAAALIGAISFHNVFGMLLMHPVDWYIVDSSKLNKKTGKVVEKSSKIKSPQKKTDDVELECLKSVSNSNQQRHSEESKEASEPLLTNTLKIQPPVSTGPKQRISSKNSDSSSVNAIETVVVVQKHTSSQASSKSTKMLQEREDSFSIKNGAVQSQKDTKTSRIIDLFDFSLLKDRTFIITSLGVSFAINSDVIFLELLPLAMFDRGYTSLDATKAVTALAAAEFLSKILLTILTAIVNVRAKTIVFLAITTMTIVKLSFFLLKNTLTGIIITMAAIGLVRVFMNIPQPLVIVENYPVEKYPACYGIFSAINGTIYVIANPIFGVIKDQTENFALCQILLIALNCSFTVPWGIELANYYRRKWSTTNQTTNLQQSSELQ